MKTELVEEAGELMRLFASIKQRIRKLSRHKYEAWKAGGFLIDTSVVSMYPNLEELVEEIDDDEP